MERISTSNYGSEGWGFESLRACHGFRELDGAFQSLREGMCREAFFAQSPSNLGAEIRCVCLKLDPKGARWRGHLIVV